MRRIAGCDIRMLTSDDCARWLSWVLKGTAAPENIGAPAWLLGFCEDGVTWGRFDGQWKLGSEVFPDLCPTPSSRTLLELRLFWRSGEVLMWRTDEGLRGRLLVDAALPGDAQFLHPDDEERPLLGEREDERRDGFVRVRDRTGAEQALPIFDPSGSLPRRLKIRHYFEQDELTGAVRVAASRLVELLPEGGAR